MTLNEHCFVRNPPPLDASGVCPDCREPWEYCCCELPEYADILETYEGASHGNRC